MLSAGGNKKLKILPPQHKHGFLYLVGFIKGFNTGQQQRLHTSTFSAKTELDEDVVGPG